MQESIEDYKIKFTFRRWKGKKKGGFCKNFHWKNIQNAHNEEKL